VQENQSLEERVKQLERELAELRAKIPNESNLLQLIEKAKKHKHEKEICAFEESVSREAKQTIRDKPNQQADASNAF
jgi:predicted RNA-binding protein